MEQTKQQSKVNVAVLGGGCFWCTQALFQRIKGVVKVQSGYAGGSTKYPTHKIVCSGKSGHAEVVRVSFNPEVITYAKILFIFMHIHDPTAIKKKGVENGSQYRSIILYQKGNTEELETIKSVMQEVKKEGKYPGHPSDILTEVKQLLHFYPAEEEHRNFYNKMTNQTYCKSIIRPNIGKLKQVFDSYFIS